MSKCKIEKFKKRVWGCSESLKGLGSNNSANQAVVVDKSDVQFFTHSDAKRLDDFSVNTCLSSGNNNAIDHKGGAIQSGSHNSLNTQFFCSTAVDKKCVEGLLARGRKATVVEKHFSKPMRVNSRVFVARFEPRSVDTSKKHHTKAPSVINSEHHTSGKGVSGCDTLPNKNAPPCIVVGQDNVNSRPIVNVEAKTRTSCPNKRGVIHYSALDNGVNGHIHDAHNDLHNGSQWMAKTMVNRG